MLIDMGHGVTSAASGDEALQYLYTEEQCDLVITDIAMPVMSGIELADRTNDARPGRPLRRLRLPSGSGN
jgi:CheY-like chemotaxis protein